jgi:dUTP pyrophosphatase
MKVKIKKLHPDAVIPAYSKKGDAGLDLTAVTREVDGYGNIVYNTGLAIEIPDGYVGLLFPRSSNCKVDLILTNHVGVVDSGYRGAITFKYAKYRENGLDKDIMRYDPIDTTYPIQYNVGDRIGQLLIIPYPQIELEEAAELSDSERGTGGYGSTGR